LPILADVTDVAAAEVFLAFFHGQEVACIVWIYDTHTISASYPHRLVFRFENSINEIFFYVVRIGVVQAEGFFFLRFDDDTVVVDGKPYFIIASFHDAGNAGGKGIAAQFTKARNAFIIIGVTGISIVERYSVRIESEPEPFTVGSENRIDIVDGRGILQVAQIPLLEERWGGW
jgi:hypothetical protein